MARPVAVVTGAGSGLGRVIAQALLDDGFRVAALGRREAELHASVASYDETLVLPTDVTDAAAVEAAFGLLVATWGRLDLLVNNAGTFGPVGDPDQIDVEEWRRTVEVNLTGTFLCARAAFAVMKAQRPPGGRIINNGSVSAHTPRPGSAAYTASKHAVTGLTKALALDGRAHRVVCGQIDIGNAATEMTASLGTAARQADGSIRPEPTFDPRHVASVVVQIAHLPLEVSVPFLTIAATGMPLLGRG